ncbi:F-box protein CPR1-like [Argentina anserina]|uniref:F-box protein CPR1-like n=1 Tax=Argentina anserina TaxID=57926 RepID=UPI0021765762|nr:F-box protein CPR1-like [Potentilla anserina]
METLTLGLITGFMAICSRIPPLPSQIYSADRLRNWLRKRFSSGSVLDKQPCLFSESWNDDIIVDILSRFPVKSLLRCPSVCKSWRALISSSYFVNKHLNHAINGINDSTNCSIRLLFLNNKHFLDRYHPEFMLVNSLKDFVGHTTSKELDVPGVLQVIVGSCNGLICLKASCSGVFPWNPSTGEASKLPNQTINADWNNMFYGFGYESRTEDYKVILGGTKTKKIDIFKLKAKGGSWRNAVTLENYGKISGYGCLSNGLLHWVERGDDYNQYYSSASRIISFNLLNLVEDKFLEMERLSFLLDNKYSNIGIGTNRDGTHEVITDPILFTIWMMLKEYGVMESWIKVQIHRSSLPRSLKVGDVDYTGPIIVLQNGEVLLTWKSGKLSSFIL